MAQDFIGRRNVNLFESFGQCGTSALVRIIFREIKHIRYVCLMMMIYMIVVSREEMMQQMRDICI